MEIAMNAHPMSRELYNKWSSIIEKHAQAGAEIEIRFGRSLGSAFDTNVGQETFHKVLRALEKYTGWESFNKTLATVYYFQGDKRLTIDETTEEQVGQVKKRVQIDDVSLRDSRLDVRLGISTEEPFEYDGEETSTRQRSKERWSFVRKNLSIDLTIVKGTPDDKDSDDDTSYQIELEIVDPSKIKNKTELFNILHKVFDIISVSQTH